MTDNPTPSANRPWCLLVHDPERGDPKWIVAFVVSGADVRSAETGAESPDEITAAWAASRAGVARPALTALPAARVWLIDESPAPGS